MAHYFVAAYLGEMRGRVFFLGVPIRNLVSVETLESLKEVNPMGFVLRCFHLVNTSPTVRPPCRRTGTFST